MKVDAVILSPAELVRLIVIIKRNGIQLIILHMVVLCEKIDAR